jgi:putative ATP-binding cassette transporter
VFPPKTICFSYYNNDYHREKIALFFGALVVAVPVTVFYRYNREKLSLYWREGMTKKVMEQYYSNRTFYVLETLRDIDNPDQRIADDVSFLILLHTNCTA